MSEFIYGKHAVFHLLSAGRRKALRLHLRKGLEAQELELVQLAQRLRVPLRMEEASFFAGKFSSVNHQGVVAESESYPYISFEELLKESLVLILDEIQDTQNLGALCRSAHLLGVGGVLLPENHAATVAAGACHASVGAVEYLKIARTSSIAKAIDTFKENEFWVYGMDQEAEKLIHQETFPKKTVLVVGSEERGLRRLVKEKCDILLRIPTVAGTVGSLNASVAGGVFLYEVSRQKLANQAN